MNYARAVVAAVALVLMGVAASAQVVSVRGGEHEKFSRLVFNFKPGKAWSIREVTGGYRISFALDRVGLRDEGVFQKIPRDRILSLTADRNRSMIFIRTGCDCPANAFLYQPGVLVVDVADPDIFAQLSAAQFVQGQDPAPPAISGLMAPEIQVDTPFLPAMAEQKADDASTGMAPPALESLPEVLDYIPTLEPILAPSLMQAGTDLSPEARERMTGTRNVILQELSRATQQGLLQSSMTQSPGESAADGAAMSGEQTIHDMLDGLPNARAQTSFDRGVLSNGRGRALTADGAPCIPDAAIAIGGWASDAAAQDQISSFRLRLFEEFDTENRDAAVGLAKTYVYMTFGAEARNVLTRFHVDGADADLLHAMAEIVDEGHQANPSRFTNQATCASTSALWAALSKRNLPRSMQVNTDAVLLAFFGLPLHLRRHLGPGLAQRFLERGDDDVVLAIRDAIGRAPGQHGEGFALLNASIDLEMGKTDSAARGFEEIAALDGSLAPDALIERIDMAIESGRKLPSGAVESVAALAFEYRGTDIGARLARAYVLANIVEDQFDEALSSLLRIETGDESESQVFPGLWSQLALGMARTQDDVVFLSAYYRHRETLAVRSVSQQARAVLASRLMGLGFGQEARAEIAYYPDQSDDASVLLNARVSIAVGDLSSARRNLQKLDRADAQELLARIEEHSEQYDQAALIYDGLGDAQSRTNADWRAGNWKRVAENADGPRQFAARLMVEVDPYVLSQANALTTGSDHGGIIAANEARLVHSAWVRETLADLLDK